MSKSSALNFIDIFAGAGGLSCGLEQAGLKCLLGVEIDKHAVDSFAINHKSAATFCGDIQTLTDQKLKSLLGGNDVHVVVGGPPCQGFSTVGKGNPKDKRNHLFLEFVRLVKITRPYFVVFENVTGLVAKKNEKTLSAIFKEFQILGYNLDVKIMSAEKYGVPEKRRRTIIIGTRINTSPLFPKETHDIIIAKTYRPPVTVGEAFKDLKTKKGEIFNHDVEAAKISNKIDLKRLAKIPEGKGIRYKRDEEQYLPKGLRLDIDWESLRENRFRQCKYQRLHRKKPSPTIMTHRHNYYHPTENRLLTQREAAKLQSFPNHFIFSGSITSQWRQIGNAVPPLIGKAIGKSLLKMYRSALKNEEIILKSKSASRTKIKIRDVREKAFLYKEKKGTSSLKKES